MARLSVIIPCYNVEQHLAVCLQHVYDQEFDGMQVVCINDGSTDSTAQELARLKANYGFELHSISNAGASNARNIGLENSKGEYIQFLDADDVLLPGKLKRQFELAHTSNADLVVGAYTNLYEDGTSVDVQPLQSDWEALIRTRMGTTSSNLWKRETVLKAGLWDVNLGSSQDYELMFRLLKNGAKVIYDEQSLSRILKRSSGSISQSSKLENWKRYIQLREEIKEHLSSQGGHSHALNVLEQYQFMAVRVLAQYDMNLARNEYNRLISSEFVPKQSAAISTQYIFLYRLLGFALAERIIKALKPDLYNLE